MERNDVGQTANQEGIVPGILCGADVAAVPKGDDVPQGDDIAAGVTDQTQEELDALLLTVL